MVLDRRKTHEIVQALLRARNKKDGGNILENVAQTRAESGDGSYREPAFGGMGFPPVSQLAVTTGDNAASQSRKFIPGPRPHPFRDPARFSYTDEAADKAPAHGIPAHDLLAFKEAPSALSRPANPQTMYGRPLAVNAGVVLPQKHWGYLWESLFPPYCKSTDDNLTFPPLINQDKEQLTEADKAACYEQFDHDREQCYKNYNYDPRALNGCHERANIIRDLCLRGEREILPWNDVDEDDVRFPKPGKGRKKK